MKEANYLNERIRISAESFSKTISTEVFCFRRVDWVLGLFVKQSGDDKNLSWLRLNGIIVVSSNLWITFSRKHGITGMGHWKKISQKSKKLVRSFGYTPWSTHLRYHVCIPPKTLASFLVREKQSIDKNWQICTAVMCKFLVNKLHQEEKN